MLLSTLIFLHSKVDNCYDDVLLAISEFPSGTRTHNNYNHWEWKLRASFRYFKAHDNVIWNVICYYISSMNIERYFHSSPNDSSH